jgi:hypothetical protein
MYAGPQIDDPELLERLPAVLRTLLERTNGYIAYHGGLHMRGACVSPEWHSLRSAWVGPDALHRLFSGVNPNDVPFAQDALGDQFLLRDGMVHRLSSESGEIESLGLDLVGFDQSVRADPVGFLSLEPLEAFRAGGGVLLPGQLLSVYPPFIAQESDSRRSMRAIPVHDRLRWLADLARSVQNLPEGAQVEIAPDPHAD